MAAQLRFVNLHLNKPQDFCHNVVWTGENKGGMFGHNAKFTPTAKQDVRGLMIWVCLSATGPGHLAVIESTMNSDVYQRILDSKCEAICWITNAANLNEGKQCCKLDQISSTMVRD